MMLKVLVCCDSFKGTLTSLQVNEIVSSELIAKGIECTSLPLADGGEGSLEVVKEYVNADSLFVNTYCPCHKPIKTPYLIKGDQAFIDMAGTSGLDLVSINNRKPLKLSSYGTGLLFRHAIDNGIKKIVFFLGGSATIDGGAGLLSGLVGEELPSFNPLPENATSLFEKAQKLLNNIDILLVTDVNNMILGEQGAVKIFGPQKGASEADILILEESMKCWVESLEKAGNKLLSNIQGLGAAGGVGLPLFAFAHVRVINGFDYFNQLLNYKSALNNCDLLITGEGCIDDQTVMGKGPGSLAKEANQMGKLVIGIGGTVKSEPELFHKVFTTSKTLLNASEMQSSARHRLKATVGQVANFIKNFI